MILAKKSSLQPGSGAECQNGFLECQCSSFTQRNAAHVNKGNRFVPVPPRTGRWTPYKWTAWREAPSSSCCLLTTPATTPATTPTAPATTTTMQQCLLTNHNTCNDAMAPATTTTPARMPTTMPTVPATTTPAHESCNNSNNAWNNTASLASEVRPWYIKACNNAHWACDNSKNRTYVHTQVMVLDLVISLCWCKWVSQTRSFCWKRIKGWRQETSLHSLTTFNRALFQQQELPIVFQ